MLLTDAVDEILRAFKNPRGLPDPLAQEYINRNDNSPCRAWSLNNQILTAMHGHSDARSFDQWKQVGRYVRKGEKAFYLRSPVVMTDGQNCVRKEPGLRYGFRGAAVFGLNQTEGDPLPADDMNHWLQVLPLRLVAALWGMSVEAYNGRGSSVAGTFWHDNGNAISISLGVTNLSTWAHELVHAADYRNGTMIEPVPHWRMETVAELGGAVLLKTLGFDQEADLGGCWQYIRMFVRPKKIGVVKACNLVLERTCKAVSLILDTAHDFRKEIMRDKLA